MAVDESGTDVVTGGAADTSTEDVTEYRIDADFWGAVADSDSYSRADCYVYYGEYNNEQPSYTTRTSQARAVYTHTGASQSLSRRILFR